MISSSKYSKSKPAGVLAPQVAVICGHQADQALNSNSFSGSTSSRSSSSSTGSAGGVVNNGNVKFSGLFKEKIDDREKYLTAKYPNHQMALIKKRLKVEFWIDERLKILFQINVRILK